MSIYVNQVAIKEFDPLVHAEFQAEGFQLRGKMRQRTGIVGTTYQFPVIDQGVASQKSIQDDVTPMNTNYAPAICTLANWNAADYTDIFSQAEINFDEKMELAKNVGRAIGRRMDQIGIDALAASGTTNIVADGGVGMTFDKIRETNMRLRANNAKRGKVYMAIDASAESDLLSQEQFINAFYVDRKAVPSGSLQGQTLFGIEFIVFGDMLEGGIPVSGGISNCFAWQEDAMGYCIGIDMRTHIDWIAQKTSWLIDAVFRAGAVAIDTAGIIQVNCKENSLFAATRQEIKDNKLNRRSRK